MLCQRGICRQRVDMSVSCVVEWSREVLVARPNRTSRASRYTRMVLPADASGAVRRITKTLVRRAARRRAGRSRAVVRTNCIRTGRRPSARPPAPPRCRWSRRGPRPRSPSRTAARSACRIGRRRFWTPPSGVRDLGIRVKGAQTGSRTRQEQVGGRERRDDRPDSGRIRHPQLTEDWLSARHAPCFPATAKPLEPRLSRRKSR